MSYRITTDSTCDLPEEFYRERDITFVPLSLEFNGGQYQDGFDEKLTAKTFYDGLRNGGVASTTQVNPSEFTAFVEPYLAAGEDVLHLAFSSGLSGTYASCEVAAADLREKYPDRTLIVVDSLAASMGEGLMLYYVDENRKKGLSIEENAQWLEENKLHLCHWFTVDDLMFLHRGGRVSKTSAIFGSLLGIKPVMHVDNEGHLIVMAKARGRNGSLEALVDHMEKTGGPDIKNQMIFISHGDSLEDAEKLKEMIRRRLGCEKFLINTIGAVIGSHSGPGTIALFFMGSER
ncbi:MAG: DegV family protein [Clostridiales bacterium]|jgi:DegV family protein with EDD domain|nr:DegV family protein [Clostridiales bacterium]